jgi:hypothetical protein
MANKKISQLDPIGTIDVNQDSIPIVDYSENVTKRTNLANIGQRVLEASSTTNLAEGTNLYFTNTRVYTKVKASLLAGSNTSITFDDALQTITIASQGNVQSVNTKTGAVVLTTTDITEGTNEYHTSARVRAVILTGLSLVTNAVISATDSVLIAFGKLQAQITANLSTLTSHTSNTSNPHATTKAQVGLSNADNTSDANKPISTATQTALNAKENTITAGTISQYYRGDKTFQTLDKSAVGLANVDDTSDANKPVSTAQQTALNAKQDTLVSGTNIKTVNSTSLLGSGNIVLTANPSGVAGAIQFSNGSAFASDATNLFWDDTNNRLGIGTNSPTHNLHVPGTTQLSYVNGTGILVTSTEVSIRHFAGSLNTFKLGSRNGSNVFTDKIITTNGTDVINLNGQAFIKGNGSTSATTSLLVQNSAGSNSFQIRDDRIIIMAGLPTSSSGLPTGALWNNLGILSVA